MLAVLICVILCSPHVLGLIPTPCASNVTASPAVCCPTPSGASRACGFPSRGECQRVRVFSQKDFVAKHTPLFADDIRVNWPERMFQYMCKCRFPYWGADCGDCVHGREGANCQHKVVYIRKWASDHERGTRRSIMFETLNGSHYLDVLGLTNLGIWLIEKKL